MYKHVCIILIGLMFGIPNANAKCINTIKNNSQMPWKIVFPVNESPLAEVNSATIPPGGSLPVDFNPLGVFGSFYVVDKQDKKYKFYFFFPEFRLGRCPYITHNGNTGSISVNEPNVGDITIDKDVWDNIVPHSHQPWTGFAS